MIRPMATPPTTQSWTRTAVLAAGLLSLGALAAFGTAGWAEHGERLWLAMADGAWINCF